MVIVLIGAAGQLGHDLHRAYGSRVIPLSHDDLELTDAAGMEKILAGLRPSLVINAAAYNLVDRAEDEPDRAYAVNALGPRNLARFCGQRDVPMLHVSSDYVFGLDAARTTPYVETDRPGPLSAYGVSKLAGEYFVQTLCPRHYVVRTCGLYGSNGGGNFVKTILRIARERSQLRVVDDQFCTPTASSDLARAIVDLVATEKYGLYHATNSGNGSWYQFAREICRRAGISVEVAPITTAEFGARARRPAYSVLDCGKLHAAVGYALPAWEEALTAYIAASRAEG